MANTFSVNLYPVPTPGETDQRLTVSNTAIKFVSTFYNENTKFVFVDVQGADIMVTFDDSTPTSTNGHLFKSGYMDFWSARRADAAKMIRAAGTDATVQASPFTV
jgi:hypothetical protein